MFMDRISCGRVAATGYECFDHGSVFAPNPNLYAGMPHYSLFV